MHRIPTLALAAALPAVASAQLATPLVSTLPGDDSSLLPGSTSRLTNLDRPVYSQNRAFFGVLAEDDSGSSSGEDLYLLGRTDGTDFFVAAQEFVTTINVGGEIRTVDGFGIGERNFGIANDGSYGVELGLDGDTNTDLVLVEGVFGSSPTTVVFQESTTVVPVAAPAIFGNSSGVFYGDAGFGGNFSLDNAPSFSNSGAYAADGTVRIAQEGFAATSSVAGAPTGTYGSIDFAGTRGDGLNATARTDVGGTEVLVLNDDVRLFEGQSLPGLPGAGVITGFYSVGQIQPDGGFLQLVNVGDDSAVVDETGTVLAATGGTFASGVVTSSSAADFFTANEDAAGNLLVGGFESGTEDAIWVYNGQVILREGDEIDLDGDGLGDDVFVAVNSLFSASLDNITLDGAFLLDGTTAVIGTALNDATGNEVGLAYLTVTIPEPATAGLFATAGLLGLRRRR
jgi:hypothetical protein